MARGRRSGWKWLGAWAVAGALSFFAITDLPGYGLLVLPLAVAASWFVLSRARRWPESLGLAVGLGAVCLLLAWVNRDYVTACYPGIVLGTGGYDSCGGFPPLPWLVACLLLSLGGMLGYASVWLRGNARRRSAVSPAPRF